jgi:hypothetical protein
MLPDLQFLSGGREEESIDRDGMGAVFPPVTCQVLRDLGWPSPSPADLRPELLSYHPEYLERVLRNQERKYLPLSFSRLNIQIVLKL